VPPFRSAGVAALLTTARDRPADWINAGQALQRILLTASTCGIAAALHTQPLELGWFRDSIRTRLSDGAYPQLVLRFGAVIQAAASVRRPPEDVLSESGSEAPPPPQPLGTADALGAVIPPEARPRAESLRDVTARLLPYWYDAIVSDLRAGACVLVVSHGNTLRALVKHLDAMPEERVAELDIPTGVPLACVLRPDMRPVVTGGRYLGSGPRR
jgi:hypothetical protein